MKSILLTTTAIVAFAGAAAADGHAGVSFSGSAALGYNDDAQGDHDGFYSDMNLDVSMTAALDNGLTVTATADVDELDNSDAAAGAVTLKIASETASLTYGDVNGAANDMWSSVGSMDQDTFYETDGEIVLRGDATFGGIMVGTSFEVNGDALEDMNLAVAGSVAGFDAAFVMQAGDNHDEVLGFRVGTTLAGADLALGYADNATTGGTSTGVSAGYTVAGVALAASYVSESIGDDNWDVSAAYTSGAISVNVFTDESENYGVEGSYDLGSGLVIKAGFVDGGEDTYVAGEYDLGGGASFVASYADDADGDAGDEVGAPEYQVGTTIAVSFSF